MQVRQAESADTAAIAGIHVRSWQAAYRGLLPDEFLAGLDPVRRKANWDRLLAGAEWPRSGILVAERDGTVTGFAHLCPTRDADEDPATVAELTSIYLAPEAWSTGVGRLLMSAAVDAFEAAGFAQSTLWVLDTNHRARRFYQAAGWHVDGAVKQDEAQGVPLPEVRYRRPIG